MLNGGTRAETKTHPVIGGQQRDHMMREMALGTAGKSGGQRGGWQSVMEQPLKESSALPAGRTWRDLVHMSPTQQSG